MIGQDALFEALGADRFQQFCQSLLSYEFPHLQALPVGQPDGGRDALAIRDGDGGVVVFQVKFVERPDYMRDVGAWLLGTIRGELPKVERLAQRGAVRYVLLTNVPGSAHSDVGSVDVAQTALDERLPIPGQVWWRNDLVVRLAKHRELKWTYRELLTGQDVLEELAVSQGGGDANRRRDAIAAALSVQYEADRAVRFKQVDLQNDLFELFIDMPVLDHGRVDFERVTSPDGSRIIRSQHFSARAGSAAAMLLSAPVEHAHRERWVVEGAPGQGKSTLAQYLCQVHRLRLVGSPQDAPEIRSRHAEDPVRLPFKVDLRELAAFVGGRDPFDAVPGWSGVPADTPRSLAGFLALQVQRYAGGVPFTVSDLLATVRTGPLLIVLDGFDEVADVDDRKAIVETVQQGLTALEAVVPNLQAVITSRPAAFANSAGFPADRFDHVTLAPLEAEAALDYAERWVRARRLLDEDAREVLGILRERLDEPHLRELARNPMQLAILLSLISTKGESLPDRRTELYLAYMTLFFDRESAKSRLVRTHRALLFALHGHLAWTLHCDAEQSSGGGTIGLEELRELVRGYIVEQGADPGLADALFQGVVERIVAIVATKQERFEFEVQPLREFFAAHHLYATGQVSQFGVARPGTRADRFRGLAGSGFWLNVLRFYAGFYTSGELPSLVDGLEDVAADDLFVTSGTQRTLAATFLADGSFELDRRSRERAVRVALAGFGSRHVLNEVQESSLPSVGFLRLPAGAGREEVVEQAVALLADETLRRDRRQHLARVLALHLDPGEFSHRWLELVRAATGVRRTRWLEVGTRTRDAGRVPIGALEEVVRGDGDGTELEARVEVLLDSGRSGLIEAHDDLTAIAIELMFRGRGLGMPNKAPVVSTLGALQSILRYALYPEISEGPPRWHLKRQTDPARTADDPWHDVVTAYARLAEDSGEPLASPLWAPVVELCAAACPGRPMLIALALGSLRAADWPEFAVEESPIDPQGGRLMERIASTRRRWDDGPWWCEQLSGAKTAFDRQLTSICGLLMMSDDMVEEALEPLGQCIGGMSSDDFTFVVTVLAARPVSRRASRVLSESVSEWLTPRLFALLRPGLQDFLRLLPRVLDGYRGTEPTLLDTQALDALFYARSQSEWRRALEFTREAYRRDQSMRAPHELGFASGVAPEIVEHASDYPLALLMHAEHWLRVMGGAATPMATVAARERWFERD